MSRLAPPKVVLVEPYWDFWEGSVDFDLRADRAALADTVRAALDVEWVEREQAQAALVLQTMATPPSWTIPQIEGLPVVIWAAHRPGRLAGDLDHGAITSEGATVGAPMLTSLLVREGRHFELILGSIGNSETEWDVQRALAVAAAAFRLRRARIARVGRPLQGYACVDTDDALLRRVTGIELVPIEAVEVRDSYQAVSVARVRQLHAEVAAIFDVQIEGEGLERSLRAACAIEDLVRRHRLDAGAMNCHVPEIRFGAEIGVTPCLGLGRSTSAGVPWTCVGDVLTAVAMLASTLLGGGAQYHELEAIDYETGELVIASSGEYDLSLADATGAGAPLGQVPGTVFSLERVRAGGGSPGHVPRRPRLQPNGWFAGDACTGACACFPIAAGPGTLVAFAQVGEGYRLIAAEGEHTGRSFQATGTANGGFRFQQGLGGWVQWCRAGANHHSSATHGRLGAEIGMLARFLGIEAVLV